jgi:hypothetical protein
MKYAKNFAQMSISAQTTDSDHDVWWSWRSSKPGPFSPSKTRIRKEVHFPIWVRTLLKACAMNTPDEDTVLKAIEDARRILGEYIAPGPRDATQTVHRLLAVLDREVVARAIDRMKRRRTMRLVE